jgi:glycine/D-amino acid oxidase-like deaminating enzyme/nitrite reductase/ring-hydroxylating ferredoxin subunit
MRTDNGRTTSAWMDIDDPLERPPLAGDAEADACVVGAGIAGLSVAYELAAAGKRVVVLDDGPIGGGETCRTTAHLASALDDRFTHLEFLFGTEGAALAARSHARAVDRIGEIAAAEKIDCAFERLPGFLFAGPSSSKDDLMKEWDAASRAGLEASLLDDSPFPAGKGVPCIRFEHQGQFHPLFYVRGLAAAVERLGGSIHCGSHVEDIEEGTVRTSDGKTVRAAHVVVATNAPINERYGVHMKQSPWRSYVVALAIPGPVGGLFWDDEEPYHYARSSTDGGKTLLIVGGEDHRTGQHDDAAERYDRLEQWARAKFPEAGEVVARWSGQVLEPADSLAFIGRDPKQRNVYVATGDSGHGMTHGAIAGMLVSDLILGKENPWRELYDPARKTPQAALEYAKDGANVMKDYCDVATPGDVRSPDDVKPGTGAVMRKGTTKIALYRDDGGELHVRSAVCPHLGCIVRWNDGEKSWDCPCHGSRFTCTGKVVNGPSPVDLPEESLKDA